MNQVALIGRMTKDPFLREVSRSKVQSSFILAVGRSFRNAQGEFDSDFILCSMWGGLAENTVKHCGKGSLVGVTGRIQSRSFEREDRTRVYVTEVIADKVQFIATKQRSTHELYAQPVRQQPVEPVPPGEVDHFQLPKRESNDLPIT